MLLQNPKGWIRGSDVVPAEGLEKCRGRPPELCAGPPVAPGHDVKHGDDTMKDDVLVLSRVFGHSGHPDVRNTVKQRVELPQRPRC
ncbi:hypothetical protein CIB48_g177 [Xylaria polymorpha]|nr:hypothetical protein CIB48_g177 [Xylaria polymorpha]